MKRFAGSLLSITLISGCVSTPIQPQAESFSAQGWGGNKLSGNDDGSGHC